MELGQCYRMSAHCYSVTQVETIIDNKHHIDILMVNLF